MLFIKHDNILTSDKMLTAARERGYTCSFTAAAAVDLFARYYPGKTLLFCLDRGNIKMISAEYKNTVPELQRAPVLTIKQ